MLLDSMFEEIKKIMMSLEIKYKVRGEKQDTAESKYAADRYINAYQGVDNFFSHTTYYVDAIKNSGLAVDDIKATEYALEPTKIPEKFRDAVLREQRKIIVNNYEDLNNYFRMLSGLPDIDADVHYADMEFYNEYEVPFKPVHEFTVIEAMQFEASGGLAAMKSLYPEAKYLNFLGSNGIDPYVSRNATNFQVLKSTYQGNSELLDKFLTIYDQNREYVMSVLYVNDFSNTKPYYDNFMALLVLVMTVQRVIIDVFKSGINMDFFDITLIKILFESYNVPFIEGLPLDYQRLLVRNLNKLLRYKSTDKVLYDIAEILGFDSSKIYKYYLVKNHRFGEDGKPIFDYIKDEDGNLVENPETMYDVYFQAIDIMEENEEFALIDSSNKNSYESIVIEDPYWWNEESELMEKLYESEFNYIETKYLHMNVMYKLTEMVFEIVHVFRLLQDKRSQSANISISLPRIMPSRETNLFNFAIFMCAAIAKKNKLTGEIITAPSQTLHLFGFDFGNDLTVMKRALEENIKYVDNDRIASYIYDMEMFRKEDVDRLFSNIRELWTFLSNSLKNAKTIEEYRAYEKIYRALHVTQDMSNIFTKSDGEVATTYLDFLSDLDNEMYNLIVEADDNTLFTYIYHGIDAIKGYVNDIKYIYGIVDNSDVLLEALTKLIRFFKSYTVDLREFNVLYVLDHRYLNAIKIIDKLKELEVQIDIEEHDLTKMVNELIHIESTMTKKELMRLYDFLRINTEIDLESIIFKSIKYQMEVLANIGDDISLYDIAQLEVSNSYSSNMKLEDKLDIIIQFNFRDVLLSRISARTSVDIDEFDSLKMKDIVSMISSLRLNDSNKIRDIIKIISSISLKDSLIGDIDYTMNLLIELKEKDFIRDIIGVEKLIQLGDTNTINDSIKIDLDMRIQGNSILEDKMSYNSSIKFNDDNIMNGDTLGVEIASVHNMNISPYDRLSSLESSIRGHENMLHEIKPLFESDSTISTKVDIMDTSKLDSQVSHKDYGLMRDKITIIRENM